MTKEELIKEAQVQVNYCEPLYPECFIQGYVASAGLREKRIAELEAQIEKMKCCGNCQKLRGRFDSKTNINILYCSDSDMKQIEVGFQMCCCKWEIKDSEVEK